MAITTSYDWNLTRTQIITGALRKLAVLPSGGTPSIAQLADGADALNALVKAFQADGMPVWAIAEGSFTVTSGTSSYAVGLTQAVNVPSTPLKIIQAAYTLSGSADVPMEIYNRYDYKDLPSSSAVTGNPIIMYYQPGHTYGNISLWPIPDNSTTVITFQYQRMFGDMDTATDNLDFPSYWNQAMIYNLAWALAPEFGIPPTDRSILQKEAMYWHEQALSYGSEEGSLYMQPDRR